MRTENGVFLEQMEVGPMAVFAYILGDRETGEAMVIDPAADTEGILAMCRRNGLTVTTIVNTHGHVDHTGGNRDMKEKTGASLVIHEEDAEMLVSTPAMLLRMFGAAASPPADRTVRDGDEIAAGRVVLKVLHTPGHSPGSMSLYRDGMVFTGDTLFVEAVGRTDLPGGSGETMFHSIRDRLLSLPDDTEVFPGHNYGPQPTSTIGRERRRNPFLR